MDGSNEVIKHSLTDSTNSDAGEFCQLSQDQDAGYGGRAKSANILTEGRTPSFHEGYDGFFRPSCIANSPHWNSKPARTPNDLICPNRFGRISARHASRNRP